MKRDGNKENLTLHLNLHKAESGYNRFEIDYKLIDARTPLFNKNYTSPSFATQIIDRPKPPVESTLIENLNAMPGFVLEWYFSSLDEEDVNPQAFYTNSSEITKHFIRKLPQKCFVSLISL